MSHASSIPYVSGDFHAAAIYCSDGRFAAQCDDFLTQVLDLPRCDRIVVPGGAGCLVDHAEAPIAAAGVVEELRFLIEAHKLDRVILIAHAGCAFYGSRLNLPDPSVEPQQRTDLNKAAAMIRRITGVSTIDAYLAKPEVDRVAFEPVGLD